MTVEEARAIIETWCDIGDGKDGGYLLDNHSGGYTCWEGAPLAITLDSGYEPDQLEALAVWMRHVRAEESSPHS